MARRDAGIQCVQYGPPIAAGASDGRIHVICAQTGANFLCHAPHFDGFVIRPSDEPNTNAKCSHLWPFRQTANATRLSGDIGEPPNPLS
jgi:hypothetical protein